MNILSSFRRSRRGAFTLVELLAVIAILAIVAVLLFPVLSRVRTAANKSKDASNLRTIGSAMLMHISLEGEFPVHGKAGHGGFSGSWMGALEPYLETGLTNSTAEVALPDVAPDTVWRSPFHPEEFYDSVAFSYGLNAYYLSSWSRGGPYPGSPLYRGLTPAQLNDPARTVMVVPSSSSGDGTTPERPTTIVGSPRGLPGGFQPLLDPDNGVNVLFCDGHVSYYSRDEDTAFYHKIGGSPGNDITQGDSLWGVRR